MKNLNQDIIIKRMQEDAQLIADNCNIDVSAELFNKLQDVEVKNIKSVQKVSQSPKYPFRNIVLPLMGVAALTLIVTNFVLPISSNKIQTNTLQSQGNDLSLAEINKTSVKINELTEQQAIKQDALYIAQVFSL